jgi:hypothetical protein
VTEKRSNETHASTTDPEAKLARKGRGKEANLSFSAHALMGNRSGLLVDFQRGSGGSRRGGGCQGKVEMSGSEQSRDVGYLSLGNAFLALLQQALLPLSAAWKVSLKVLGSRSG